MDDWQRYKSARYDSIISHAQSAGFEFKQIAWRIIDNKTGIYETRKTYENGIAYNDGSWLIYNTSRRCKHADKVIYKDKIFCSSKSQLIEDLYSYVLFLRKIGIDVMYEMHYYAIAFLVKYLRFYDGMFNCTADNQRKIGELCQSAMNKEPEEIDCDTRKDARQFAIDPDMIDRMTKGMNKAQATAEVTKLQKRILKKRTDNLIEKWYQPELSIRKNVEALKAHGVEVSVGRVHQWIKEHAKDKVFGMDSKNEFLQGTEGGIQVIPGQ